MKMKDWEDLAAATKGILRAHYMLHEQAHQAKMLQEIQFTQASAGSKGMAGAAGQPQTMKGVASQPAMDSQKEGLT
jgi:hypothetical protein